MIMIEWVRDGQFVNQKYYNETLIVLRDRTENQKIRKPSIQMSTSPARMVTYKIAGTPC